MFVLRVLICVRNIKMFFLKLLVFLASTISKEVIPTELIQESLEALKEYVNLDDMVDVCYLNENTLGLAFEFVSWSGRKTYCVRNPWRTHSWMVDETCNLLCREERLLRYDPV